MACKLQGNSTDIISFHSECDEMFCSVENSVYSRLDATVGQFVDLFCNTSPTSAVMWTYDFNDPLVDYVYWNGRTDSTKPRLSIKFTGGNDHSLQIFDVRLNDSGLYNCYDGKGSIKAGYQLIVNGMCWFIYTQTFSNGKSYS